MISMFVFGAAMAASGMGPTTPPAAQGTAARSSRDGRVICRREDQVGTRLAPRVCMTRAQWRDRDAEARQNAHGLLDESGRVGGHAPPTPE